MVMGAAMAQAGDDYPDINKLWNFQDAKETRARFEALRLQVLTQIARTHGLEGNFDKAHAILDEVDKALTDHPDMPVVKVRSLLERGRAFNSGKQPQKAMPLFEQAWDLARGIEQHGYAVDAAHMCAIATPGAKDKRAWNLKAIAYAEESKDPRAMRWLGSLYNNMGWDYFDQQAYDHALDMHQRCEKWHAGRAKDSRGHLIAKWSVAKQLRMLKRYDEALEVQRALEAHYKEQGKGGEFVNEEIAEILHATGRQEQARPYFRKAYDVLKDIGWVAEDKQRIARLKKLAEQ